MIEAHKPDVAAIEGAFFFRNAKTAMVLGMARGAVVSVLGEHQLSCYEYAPTRAKQAITGHGRASKEHVATIMAGMLNLDVSAIPDDATDALSICVCHGLTAGTQDGIHLKDPI